MTLKSSSSENKAENKAEKKTQNQNSLSLLGLTIKSIKRHIWLPVLAVLGFVLALPVASALAINNFNNWVIDSDIGARMAYCRDWAGDLSMLWQLLTACIVIVGALLSVMVMFRYLHVRAQVDFYHSLPVRRERLFASNLLASFLVFLVPYLLATLLNVLVLFITGWTAYVNMGMYLQFVVFNILVYVLFMGCGALAMQLSGTMPSALKILLMTFGLAPLLAGLYELLSSVFLETWASMTSNISMILLKASVVERYFILSSMARGDNELLAQTGVIAWQDWLAAALLAAAMLGISLALYRRRNSEVAGSTLAFRWQKPFYKYPLVICGSIMMGIFFYLAGEQNILWMYFGAVLGAMFMALVLEIFIKSDFKAIKKGWRSALVAAVAMCLLFSAYTFDWLGFDSRVPDPSKVQTVYLYSYSLNRIAGDNYYYYDDFYNYFDSYWTLNDTDYNYVSQNMLAFSEPENVAAVLAIVDSVKDEQSSDYSYYSYEGPYSSEGIRVVYRLNNGSTIARKYYIYNIINQVHQQAYETIVGSQEWRQQQFINQLDLEKTVITDLYSYMPGSNYRQYLEDYFDWDWHKQVLQTAKQEFAQLSAEELLYNCPVGELNVGCYESRVYDPESGWYNYSGMRRYDFSIYPSMTQTIELLNQQTGGMLNMNLALSNILEVREYRAWSDSGQEEAATMPGMPGVTETYSEKGEYGLVVSYHPETDGAAIEQILQNSVVNDASFWSTGIWNSTMSDRYYEVDYYGNPENAIGGYEDYNESDPSHTRMTITLYPRPSRELFSQLIANQ